MIRFPAVPPGQDVVVSATTFVAFCRCPEQAAARVRGEYGPDSRAALVGGLAHRIFARHLTRGPIDDGDFELACREEIGTALNAKLGSLGIRPSALAAVISEVGDLYRRFKRVPRDGFAAAESSLEVEPSPGVILRGTVDAVFSGGPTVRLVDWKTGGLADAATQLAFYALLWALFHGTLPARLEAVSVRTGERLERVPTWDAASGTAADVARLVTAIRRSVATGRSLDRCGGPWCRYCPLREGCAEGTAALQVALA